MENQAPYVTIKFFNYTGQLALTNTQPLEIGFIQGRKLYFNYTSMDFATSRKTLYYSFMLGENV
jgi:hypothetical protein